MVMQYWGGPGLVKAYSLELLVDAVRQHQASRQVTPSVFEGCL